MQRGGQVGEVLRDAGHRLVDPDLRLGGGKARFDHFLPRRESLDLTGKALLDHGQGALLLLDLRQLALERLQLVDHHLASLEGEPRHRLAPLLEVLTGLLLHRGQLGADRFGGRPQAFLRGGDLLAGHHDLVEERPLLLV